MPCQPPRATPPLRILRPRLLLLPLLNPLLHPISLPLQLGLIPKLDLLLLWAIIILRPLLCPHPFLTLCGFCLFLFLVFLRRGFFRCVFAWSAEPGFGYVYRFDGYGCVFIFVDGSANPVNSSSSSEEESAIPKLASRSPFACATSRFTSSTCFSKSTFRSARSCTTIFISFQSKSCVPVRCSELWAENI
jgi:hypothetical protein